MPKGISRSGELVDVPGLGALDVKITPKGTVRIGRSYPSAKGRASGLLAVSRELTASTATLSEAARSFGHARDSLSEDLTRTMQAHAKARKVQGKIASHFKAEKPSEEQLEGYRQEILQIYAPFRRARNPNKAWAADKLAEGGYHVIRPLGAEEIARHGRHFSSAAELLSQKKWSAAEASLRLGAVPALEKRMQEIRGKMIGMVRRQAAVVGKRHAVIAACEELLGEIAKAKQLAEKGKARDAVFKDLTPAAQQHLTRTNQERLKVARDHLRNAYTALGKNDGQEAVEKMRLAEEKIRTHLEWARRSKTI